MGCHICPRGCPSTRTENSPSGFCMSPSLPVIHRAAPHFGEEPCITGTEGSGAVFFGGCSLGCVFCQNRDISRGAKSSPLSIRETADVFLRLQDRGVHNINLVTGSHYTPAIAKALEMAKLTIPVVWNSSGYEEAESIRMLDGLVQIYMPDFKFSDRELAERYANAPDYPEKAMAAIREMYRQRGKFEFDENDLLLSGVLVRHLVLPESAENTLGVIYALEDNLPAKNILFSLMAQYTPMPGTEKFPELQRKVSPEEYSRCLDALSFSEITNGFTQEPDSATTEMIPDFDGTGVR